jgi:hypothetical protein
VLSIVYATIHHPLYAIVPRGKIRMSYINQRYRGTRDRDVRTLMAIVNINTSTASVEMVYKKMQVRLYWFV